MAEQPDLFDVGKREPAQKAPPPEAFRCTPGGVGPEGETCGTCRHKMRVGNTKKFLKCGLCQAAWTHGPGTDIRARWPACAKWEAKDA